jgi:hypothetical protein
MNSPSHGDPPRLPVGCVGCNPRPRWLSFNSMSHRARRDTTAPVGRSSRRCGSVELLLCTHPVAPEVVPLLDQVENWDQPRETRAPLVLELRRIVTAELEGAAARWTPHYDRGLHAIALATDDDLLEPQWEDALAPMPYTRMAHARTPLATHAHLCARLSGAEAVGARTLAGAFAQLTIGNGELPMWFALCPDRDALDRRLRAAALAYLRATREHSPSLELEDELLASVEARAPRTEIHLLRMRWFIAQPSSQRQCALGLAITEESAPLYDFTNVPAALIELLGNPFDPLTTMPSRS